MAATESANHTVCLVGLNQEILGRRFYLRSGMTIGRSISADVFLPDLDLPRHLYRVVQRSGEWFLERVGGPSKLFQKQELDVVPFACGSHLKLGRFLFLVLEAPKAASSAPVGANDKKTEADDSPCFEIRRHSVVMVVRIHGADGASDLFSTVENFRNLMQPKLESAGLFIGNTDSLYWRVFGAAETKRTLSCTLRLIHSAMMIKRSIYTFEAAGTPLSVRLAIVALPSFVARGISGVQSWGAGVDYATKLVFSGKTGTCFLDTTERLPILARSFPLHGRVVRRVFGIVEQATRFTTQLNVTLPVKIVEDQTTFNGLAIRLRGDSQRGRVSVITLSGKPMSPGRRYRLSFGSSLETAEYLCAECRPLSVGYGLHFWGDLTDSLSELFSSIRRGDSPPQAEAA